MIDQAAAERAVRDYLVAIGLDPAEPTLRDTPQRVARAAADLFSGVGGDPVAALGAADLVEGGPLGPVAVSGIPFSSVCEHHLLPFRGTVSIAYLPGRALAGLGGFDAAIRVLAARPQLQERLADEIAAAIQDALAPRGAIVAIDAEHSCMWARGGRTVGALVRSVAARGDYDLDGAHRAEALALVARA